MRRSFSLLVRIGLSAALAGTVSLAPQFYRAVTTYTGVNLAGAEFGATSLLGTYNTNYTYPTSAEVNYYVGKDMNTFRWERLQLSASAALNSTELSRMDTFVNYATSQGAYVVLDPHNFVHYYPSSGNMQSDPARAVGTAAVPNSVFADFWSRVATQYKSNDHVIFNLESCGAARR
jgi:endoglucanase